MSGETCRTQILSNDYADFFYLSRAGESVETESLDAYCYEDLGFQIGVIHYLRSLLPSGYAQPAYRLIPKLYGLMDTISVEATGSIRLQEQPALQLKGRGVLIGIVDTGIDYTHPAFLDDFGRTRIVRIWDQTVQTGTVPEGFSYGSEYTNTQIDAAIQSEEPLSVVPSEDTVGHGTFLAGVAAGRASETGDFIGAAPEAEIAVVKVKQAKEYLKDFFCVPRDVTVFQETDIMFGVRYLFELSGRLGLPLVLLLGIGGSQGAHDGTGPLARQLRGVGETTGCVVVAAAGNEGDKRHHFRGRFFQENEIPPYVDVELRVAEEASRRGMELGDGTYGFAMELWGRQPDLFTVGFISPTGQQIARIPSYTGETFQLSFIFEETELRVDYWPIEGFSGDELILLRFKQPAAGIWTIRVYGMNLYSGIFDIWLPIQNFLAGDTYFLEPDPDITITEPGNTPDIITISGYDAGTGAYYVESGRGFGRDGALVPDFAAPSVNVTGPVRRGNYAKRSGTSIGAALAAGACAQIVEWAYGEGENSLVGINNRSIQNFLIRGAEREAGMTYPNERWGYGRLNAYRSFELWLRQ